MDNNIDIEKFNMYSKQLAYILSFGVIMYIVVDELVKLSYFVFTYKYSYDYGNYMGSMCGAENLEYETGRFQSITSINDYILPNDVYNKYIYILILYILVLICTFIICYNFGVYYYNSVIEKNNCLSILNMDNSSYLKQFLICFLGENIVGQINTCFLYYIILFVIIALIPISILLNIIFNFNIFVSDLFYMPIFIILFVLILISKYYVSGIDLSLLTFFVFLTVFISWLLFYEKISNIYNNYNFFNNSFFEINSENKNTNKYNKESDYKFYKLYSNKEPEKPIFKTLENIVHTNVVSSTIDNNYAKQIPEFNAKSKDDEFTESEINAYEELEIHIDTNDNIKKNYEIYNKSKKDYNEKMKKYEEEMNFYNNNNIFNDDPDNISIIDILLTFIGLKNQNDISFYIIILLCFLASIVLCLFISYNDLLYNVFIIILNIFIIILLINSVTTVNTYINKFFIYKNSNLYKKDMYLLNNKFSDILNSVEIDGDMHCVDTKIGNNILYNIYSAMFSINLITMDTTNQIINKFSTSNKNLYHWGIMDENGFGGDTGIPSQMQLIYKTNSANSSYYDILNRADIFKKRSNGNWINPYSSPITKDILKPETANTDAISGYTLEDMKNNILSYNLISMIGNIGDNVGNRCFLINNNQFKAFINNIFLQDISKINNITDTLKKNIKVDYNNPSDTNITSGIFRTSMPTANDIKEANKNDNYKKYETIVNKCVHIYKIFVLEMRDIIGAYLIENNIITTCSSNKVSLIILPDLSKNSDLLSNLYVKKYYLYFNNSYRKMVDSLYQILNFEGNTIKDYTNNIVSDIINNYNYYNQEDSHYNKKTLIDSDVNITQDIIMDDELYSNKLISSMNNISNSVYVIVLLSIFAILQPIYI